MSTIDRLHRDLGLKRLSAGWAKTEIFLGLLAAGTGLVAMCGRGDLLPDYGAPQVVGGIVLFVLGGYLAMAGHRSHLYQSQNKVAAWLADVAFKNNASTE